MDALAVPASALYANDIADQLDLPGGAGVVMPNDPTNESRAVKLLAPKGLVEEIRNPITL